ncbi:Ldh family oxidoreductase [Brevibacillus sp. H7]|uniref:Ldh family oxidoreductase n=1 Tax=Brevibacillus sp. H7 TaxID=3349138 RepID=UPI00381CBF18
MSSTLFQWKKLEDFSAEVFTRAGVPRQHAETVAQSLLHADLRGIESHGLARMPIYVQRIERGLVEPKNEAAVVSRKEASTLLDGQNQLGAVVGKKALSLALEGARKNGTAVIGVRKSNHFGACSFYAEQAIEQGMILLVLSNAPQTMAPTGGIRPFFGSNPLAIGIPAGEEPPFLLDMATSVAARGKIALAAKKGESIPHGWALDAAGMPTTDADKALEGTILPIGGPKGYGIAMFIDILCGVLTGAGFGESVCSLYDNWEHSQNVGHVFLAIEINRFMPLDLFRQRMDTYIRQVKAVPKADGISEILIPGELELRTMKQRKLTGIPLAPPIVRELKEMGSAYGVDLAGARLE